eukprot:CAMPEP_0176001370 /NCGR_PEP_ID=MMETSP0120_2-20121206/86_1 /TAXON_ID=160619 /ORGANISM="Kryptoperidinium foliaceum, Strain CCMP 1326" /LENGTH=172 /DNA_ID=CAMNT_0017333905 /DNA_START=129 /DNA_END=647 /DNA_ORIENTATION=+
MTIRTGSCILLLTLSQILPSITGFSVSRCHEKAAVSTLSRPALATALNSKAQSIFAGEATIEDKNGQEIAVGSIVRVRKENLKAYQVPPKARGSFNDKKEFVPASEDGGRSTQCLELPVGMRGVVTKVTDTEVLSANFPIAVKFTPGENADEGYDPPAPFVMHFGDNEIECV